MQFSVLPGQTETVDLVLTQTPGALELVVNPVQTPVSNSTQTISGTVSYGATVSVVADTMAAVGPVTYPDATTWQCTLSNLSQAVLCSPHERTR